MCTMLEYIVYIYTYAKTQTMAKVVAICTPRHANQNIKSFALNYTTTCFIPKSSSSSSTRPQFPPFHAVRAALPLLHKQEMHCDVGNHDESAAKDGEADNIVPEGKVIEAECRQDGRARHLNVKTIAVVLEAQLGDLVDNEAFVAVVKNGEL